jgi:hypothetical protein
MSNVTDVTEMSDAVLDILIDYHCGVQDVDCSRLSTKECYQLAKAMKWEMTARVINWCEFNRAN